jgi:hypothetical protein
MSEVMFLFVRLLKPLRLPALQSRQSGSFALPESGVMRGCAHSKANFYFEFWATGS